MWAHPWSWTVLLCSQLCLWGSPFWVRFLSVWPSFLSNHRGSHTPSLWMVHAGCVFVAGIHHLGHECQDILSMCDGMHVYTDQTSVYNTLIRKSFGGNGVRMCVNSKGKIPSAGDSEEGGTRRATSRKTVSPTHYPNWAVLAPIRNSKP